MYDVKENIKKVSIIFSTLFLFKIFLLQLHRLVLFDRLLLGYPYKRLQVQREATQDIPPIVRNYIWAALLEVEGDVYGAYDAVDKETPTTTDRQVTI